MSRCILLLFALFVSFSVQAQIVNIEGRRMQSDTTGWMGDLGTTFSLTQNKQRVLSLGLNTHVQYKTDKSLYLLLTDYNLLKGNNQDLVNNMFYHLRYNRKLNEWLRWEVFTQWQQNTIAGIDQRILAGTGPRFKVFGRKRLRMYAGTAAMYEYEKEKVTPSVYHNDIRSSSYVSFTYFPNELIEIVSTTFYQPLFRQLSDFRFLNQLTLNVKATDHVSITTRWNYLYDAFPAAGVPQINYVLSNGISYKF